MLWLQQGLMLLLIALRFGLLSPESRWLHPLMRLAPHG